jgi:3-oxoacyl-[acyl-carrier-protein] synthase II
VQTNLFSFSSIIFQLYDIRTFIFVSKLQNLQKTISIIQINSISALGNTSHSVWENYHLELPLFQKRKFSNKSYWIAPVSESIEKNIEELKEENSSYQYLDRSVLLAILASREALKGNAINPEVLGVNLGSSRGATQLFESHHQEFLATGKVKTRTSPTTTLGNIASWVAQDLQTQGPVLSHSITCATALHALINGVAWLRSGMADTFLVGGSEAPLTDFTLAQMEALKLYSKKEEECPCESMKMDKKSNSMVLGEAASVCILEVGISDKTKAIISGIGYATEPLSHSISITPDADCFQKSMKMALKDAVLDNVDVIVMHAPGTIKGDLAELNAIHKIFESETPFLTTNKWKIGHTFGASGAMSLEMAVLILQHQEVIYNPFYRNNTTPNTINHIMINAVGFGGNAVSIIISKPGLYL